jgi:glutathione S-transferase
MLTLFMAPGSSSMAVHIALHEIGVKFTMRPLSFARREHQQPAYLAINPEGKVPTLLIDGRPLTEVAGILFYLAHRYPQAKLLPTDDAEAQARIVSWMSLLAATVHPARRAGPEHARRIYALVEQRMAGRAWVEGARLSIADIHLFRLFWRFRRTTGSGAEAYPTLNVHHDRMMNRAAVQQVLGIESALGYELPP